MSINIAFDFDGVCTDLSFFNDHKVNRSEFLYSPISIAICELRRGIVELMSVSSLFSDIFILTSRPDEAKNFIKDWLLKNQLSDLVKDVICCGGISKAIMMEKYDICLLVDDEQKNLPESTKYIKGILWFQQSWLEVLPSILSFFVDSHTNTKNNRKQYLKDFQLSTVLGSSPVFILELNDEIRVKLRVCSNTQVKNRILSFLKITEENDYQHVARLIDVKGLAILKTFVEGVSILSLESTKRLDSICKAGVALAKLHLIRANEFISDMKLVICSNDNSLLVFSADNYNMIVTNKNTISFIDLEACNFGSRWIDCYWAEKLLCQNPQEKEALFKGYFSVYKGDTPSLEERKLAQLNYKIWLTYQLKQSKMANLSNLKKLEIVDNALKQLWIL